MIDDRYSFVVSIVLMTWMSSWLPAAGPPDDGIVFDAKGIPGTVVDRFVLWTDDDSVHPVSLTNRVIQPAALEVRIEGHTVCSEFEDPVIRSLRLASDRKAGHEQTNRERPAEITSTCRLHHFSQRSLRSARSAPSGRSGIFRTALPGRSEGRTSSCRR